MPGLANLHATGICLTDFWASKVVVMRTSIILLISCLWLSCQDMWGVHKLGNNLALLEGDKLEDRAVIYCEGDCNAGIYVVPTYERHMDSGHYSEYVARVKGEGDFVIVETRRIKENKMNYWVVKKELDLRGMNCSRNNCDSIIRQYVNGPLSLAQLDSFCREYNFDTQFK